MSGRHKMPPAGRRKVAADPVDGTEQAITDEIGADTAIEPAHPEPVSLEKASAEPESVTADVVEEPDDEPAEPDGEVPGDGERAADGPAQAAVRTRRLSLRVGLAVVALVLAVACGVFGWQIRSYRASDAARTESVQAARDITVQMLSYEPDTVEQQLNAVRDRLTGNFLGSYTALTEEVIPAAQAQQIAAVAEVPRIGSVNATPDRVELVLFVNQSVSVGDQAPQKTPSVVRVTMVKDGDRWLMSEYEPVPM